MYRKKSASTIEVPAISSKAGSQKCSPSSSVKKGTAILNRRVSDKENRSNNLAKNKKIESKQTSHTSSIGNIKKMKERVVVQPYTKQTHQKKQNRKATTHSTTETPKLSNFRNKSSLVSNKMKTEGEQYHEEKTITLMINMFKITRKVNEGMFSSTFEATHITSGLLVNIKVYEKKKIKELRLQNRIIQELKFRLSVKHNNLQKLYGFFDDEVNMYLVEEYFCNNWELLSIKQHIQKSKRLAEKQCGPIFKQIVGVVASVNDQGYCLRNLQTQTINMFMGIVKVTDFSWVTSYNANNRSRNRDTFCGSVKNAPPELLRGDSYDQSIDVWGLGLVLYTMAVGVHPFKDMESIIVPQNIRVLNQLNFPIFLSNQLADLLGKTLENKQNRISIQQVCEHQWVRMCEMDGFVSRQFWNFWALKP